MADQKLRLMIQKAWKRLPPAVRLRLVRLTQPKFTVSAAAVIVNAEGEVLLLKHLLRPFSGWGLPGGFIDAGESAEAAIVREVREETGLILAGPTLFEVRTIGRHVEVLFRAESVGEARVSSGEIIELRWFALDSLPADLGSAQRRLIADVVNLRD